jgi:hypothetical protein
MCEERALGFFLLFKDLCIPFIVTIAVPHEYALFLHLLP